jgi:hypothetical protein
VSVTRLGIRNWRQAAATAQDSLEMNVIAEGVRGLARTWEHCVKDRVSMADAVLAEAVALWLRCHHPTMPADPEELPMHRLVDLFDATEFYARQSYARGLTLARDGKLSD